MMELPGYVICEQIHENNRISVYRGYASDSHMPVILKVLKKEEADPVGISRFMYEYEMVSNMNIEGVVKLLGMEQSASCFALVMEDVGGVSLRKYMEDHPLSIYSSLSRLQYSLQRLSAGFIKGLSTGILNQKISLFGPSHCRYI